MGVPGWEGGPCIKRLGVLFIGVQKTSLVLLRMFSLKGSIVRAVAVPIRVSGRKKKELVLLTCEKKNIQVTPKKHSLVPSIFF